jgi:hypothetical protein
MKSFAYKILPFLLVTILSIKCSKEKDCVPPSLTANSNGPIYAGGTLNLSATSDAGASFSWSGPNGFTSSLQNPTIPNVTAAATGDYTVISKVGDCDKSKTVAVSILPNPPCTPANNTISFVYSMSFTSTTCGIAAAGRYQMRGVGLQGDYQIQFYNDPIQAGNSVYDLSTVNTNSNNAFMQIDIGGIYANWQATSGKLYVTIANNKIIATFCSVTFGNIQGGPAQNGSGKLNCP